jgi:hypothetical protein
MRLAGISGNDLIEPRLKALCYLQTPSTQKFHTGRLLSRHTDVKNGSHG